MDKTVHDRPATDFDADGFANYFTDWYTTLRLHHSGVVSAAILLQNVFRVLEFRQKFCFSSLNTVGNRAIMVI